MALKRTKKWNPDNQRLPKKYTIKKSYFYLFFLGFFIFGVYYFLSRSLQAHSFQLQTGREISSPMHDTISRELEQLVEQKQSLATIKQRLWEQFGIVNHISLVATPRQCVEVVIEAASPFFILNDAYVLNVRKKIVPIEAYYPESLLKIPHITAKDYKSDQSDSWAQEYFEFLTSLDPQFFEQFNLVIESLTRIEALDKVDTRWKVITSVEHKLTPALIKRYTQIKQEQVPSKQGAYVDARFEDMLVFGK